MPTYNRQFDLRGQKIKDTYPQVLQYSEPSESFFTGQGMLIDLHVAVSDESITSSYARYAPPDPVYSSSVSNQFNTKQDILVTGGTYTVTSSWSSNSISASYAPVEPEYSKSVSTAKQNALVTGNVYTITSSWSSNSRNSISASWAPFSDDPNAVTASFANSASWASQSLSSSWAPFNLTQSSLRLTSPYSTALQVGNSLPIYLSSGWPTLAFNSFYNNGVASWVFGPGSSNNWAAFENLNVTNGQIEFYFPSAAGNSGSSWSPTKVFAISYDGMVKMPLLPDGVLIINSTNVTSSKNLTSLDVSASYAISASWAPTEGPDISSSWALESVSSSYPIFHRVAGDKMVVAGNGILECISLSSSAFVGGYALESSPSKVVRENLNVSFVRLGYIGDLSSSAQVQLDVIASGSGVKNAVSASWAPIPVSASWALSSSTAKLVGGGNATIDKFGNASFGGVTQTITLYVGSVGNISASISFDGTISTDGTIYLGENIALNPNGVFTGVVSIDGTSSYADQALSASWAPMPVVSNSSSWASSSISASYADKALSASWAFQSLSSSVAFSYVAPTDSIYNIDIFGNAELATIGLGHGVGTYLTDGQVTTFIVSSPQITGSLNGNADTADTAISASWASSSFSSSYAVSASYAVTTSYIEFLQFIASSSLFASASVSSSWASHSFDAESASWAPAAGLTPSSTQPITSSWSETSSWTRNVVDGTYIVNLGLYGTLTHNTGDFFVDGTGNAGTLGVFTATSSAVGFVGTASWASNVKSSSWASQSLSASWAPVPVSSSWASQSLSASWAPVPVSASWASSSFSATSASFASRSFSSTTSSWASASFSATTASWASASFSATTASWASSSFSATSASFASRSLTATSASWASSSLSASYALTSSYVQTASWAINVVSGGTGTTLVFTDTTAMTQSWGPADYYVNFFDYTKSLYTPAADGMYRLDVVAVGWITGSGNRTIYFGAKFIDEIGAYSILDNTTGYLDPTFTTAYKGLTMAGTITPNAYSGGLEPFRYYFSYLFSGKAGNAIEYYWTDGGAGLGDGANPISYSMITKASIEKLT